jgi:hypothetical protein
MICAKRNYNTLGNVVTMRSLWDSRAFYFFFPATSKYTRYSSFPGLPQMIASAFMATDFWLL